MSEQPQPDLAQPPNSTRAAWIWTGIFCLAAVAAFAAMRHSLDASGQTNCSIGLRRIGLALQEYHDLHGSFPPAWVTDAEGRRIHSWRALILEPWLETTFEVAMIEYRFDVPWDAPHNRELFNDWPTGLPYRCPSSPSEPLFTNYVMVVGDGLFSNGTGASRRDDITDGPSQTIAVIEVLDSGIEWMEPRDLSLDQLVEQINEDPSRSISSSHAGGALVLMADGTTRFLGEDLSTDELRSLLTVAGGD